MTDNLPEGLTLIADPFFSDGEFETFEFYEDPEDPKDSAICEFTIRRDGCVEIASGGAPGVPAEVLRFIADKADQRRAGGA